MTTTGRHVVLVGMMGSGKSTVGNQLARALGRPFVDTDARLEADTGRSVAALISDEGEASFRRREAEVVRSVLADATPAVVATGGGAVIDPDNRAAMTVAGLVVWLRAHPEELAVRVASGPDRPLLGDDPMVALTRLTEDRDRWYQEVADVVIDTDGHTPDEVVARVAAVLSEEVVG